MKAAAFMSALTASLTLNAGEADAGQAKADAAAEMQAACAVEKNGGDVAWGFIVQSGQSGLKGPALDGANAYALFAMARDCGNGANGFDNKRATAFSKRAFALWGGDRNRQSAARPIDAWADCLADREAVRGKAFLFAKDVDFAGPKVIVEGVDPVKGVFAPSTACDAVRPADPSAVDVVDLYARLNYRLRAQPRLAAVSTPSAAMSEKN